MSNNFYATILALVVATCFVLMAYMKVSQCTEIAEKAGRRHSWTTHAWHGEVERWRTAGRHGPRPRWGARY
jgi:hypothetical protein